MFFIVFAMFAAPAWAAVPLDGQGKSDDPYLIKSETDWDNFAKSVSGGETYEGKTVKLTANISVTTMAGTKDGETIKGFSGTFDGDGHTLTFNYTATDHYCAPFFSIDGATIKYLKVAGTISTGYKCAAGIAAYSFGKSAIQNCWSSVIINRLSMATMTTLATAPMPASWLILEAVRSPSPTACLMAASRERTPSGAAASWAGATRS